MQKTVENRAAGSFSSGPGFCRLLGACLVLVVCQGWAQSTLHGHDFNPRLSPIPRKVQPAPKPADSTAVSAPSGALSDSTRLAASDSTAVPETKPAEPRGKPDTRDAAYELFEITDENLVSQLWKMAGRDSLPEPGNFQVLLVSDSTGGAWLLREGTQVGSLPPGKAAWVRQRLHVSLALNDGGLSRTLSSGFWGNFWNPGNWIEPFQWKTGLEFNTTQSGTTFRNTTPLYEQRYDLTFTQRPDFWLTTEVGAHIARQNGGLRRNLYNPLDSRTDWEPWGKFVPWGHAAIGVPGIKWEVALANRVFPEYFWLDPNAGEGTYRSGIARGDYALDTSKHYSDGTVMRNWNDKGKNPKPSPANFSQTLRVKAGNIRYNAHFDRDVYRHPVHEVLFDELYAPFGQWAIGFVASGNAMHTRLRFDLLPWHAGVGSAAYGARVRAYFLRVNLDYRDADTYRLGLSTNVLFDGPFLRPGENP